MEVDQALEVDDALDVIVSATRARFGPRGAELNGQRIAEVIGQLVSAGDLIPGQKLPTVRALSHGLRVSPSTVAEAWRSLRVHSVISTDRRRGTTVRSTRGNVDGRYWHVPIEPGQLAHDLTTGTPDPALLPPIAPALARVQLETKVTSYLDRPVIPELEEILRAEWPNDPDTLTIVDGAQDALDRTINSLVNLGDAVVVDNPTFPPIIDMLDLAGARMIPVRSDDEGILPEDLEAALEEVPVAMFTQPRAHNPTGVSLSAPRAKQLATLLAGTRTIVVEDDHSGWAAGGELHSLATHLPQQVVHIRSFSKTHGPDLRLAAIGGPAQVLDPIVRRRHLGPSWTSRLLQRVLFELLSDEMAQAMVVEAGHIYNERRTAMTDALRSHGLKPSDGIGMNIWLPVDDEQRVIASLAAQGIGVAPGRPFMVSPLAGDHIRLTIALVAEGYDKLATAIAGA